LELYMALAGLNNPHGDHNLEWLSFAFRVCKKQIGIVSL